MQYYEDSYMLNEYLGYWRDSLDDYWKNLYESMPESMKQMAAECGRNPELRKKIFSHEVRAAISEVVQDVEPEPAEDATEWDQPPEEPGRDAGEQESSQRSD